MANRDDYKNRERLAKLRAMACHEPYYTVIAGERFLIPDGVVVTSTRKIAKYFIISQQAVCKYIKNWALYNEAFILNFYNSKTIFFDKINANICELVVALVVTLVVTLVVAFKSDNQYFIKKFNFSNGILGYESVVTLVVTLVVTFNEFAAAQGSKLRITEDSVFSHIFNNKNYYCEVSADFWDDLEQFLAEKNKPLKKRKIKKKSFPPHPPLKEKPHTHKKNLIKKDVFWALLEDVDYWKHSAESLHVTTEKLKAVFLDFISEASAKDKEYIQTGDVDDLKKHFFDCARRTIRAEARTDKANFKNQNISNNNQNISKHEADKQQIDKRRRTPPKFFTES